MKDNNIDKLIAVLLTSAVGGALIGLLMSSKRELSRSEKIAQKGDKYLEDITDMIKEIRHFADRKSRTAKADIEATRDDVDELSKNAKTKGRDLLRRAKKLLSSDYLD